MSEVKQITADFELQTRIRRISQQVMTILLKNHDNIFDFIKENRGLMQNFNERIYKNEALCGLIDSKIDTRLDRIEVLSKDIHNTKEFCFEGLKNLNGQVASFQKQIDEVYTTLRAQRPIIEKTNNDVNRLDYIMAGLKQSITTMQQTNNERTLKQSQSNSTKIDKVRADFDKMLVQITMARQALLSKQQRVTELCCDLEMWKTCRPQLDDKINQLFIEVECRATTVDMLANRKYFDERMMGYFENVNKSMGKLDGEVRKRIKLTEQKTESIFKDQQEITNKIKAEFENSIIVRKQEQDDLNRWLTQRFLEIDTSIKESVRMLENRLEEKQTQIDNMVKQAQKNYGEFTKQSATTTAQLKTVSNDVYTMTELTRNNERIVDELKAQIQAFRQRIQTFSKQEGSGTARFDEIEQQFSKLRKIIDKSGVRIDQLNSTIKALQNQIVQISDRVNKTNEIVLLTKSEIALHNEKQYSRIDQIKLHSDKSINDAMVKLNDIKNNLKVLEALSAEMARFSQKFAEQLEANELFSNNVVQRIDSAISQITKFRSDINIRLECTNKEIVKLVGELKSTDRTINSTIDVLSTYTEIFVVMGACFLSHQFDSSNDKIKQQTASKYSSMFDGFVVELDSNNAQDTFKYRGEIVRRVGLLSNLMQYLLKEVDTLRKSETLGKAFEPGRAVFQAIHPSKKHPSEQKNRRNSFSLRTINKREGSIIEFPKLDKKD